MSPSVVQITRAGLVWSAAAPVPVVVASERRCLFAFEDDEAMIQTAEFIGCTSVRFGFPNDEVQHGLRLWDAGLVHHASQ